ncbi:hypothetical protein M2145_002061 [Lachnospiraceae bacterium PF1-21]|uniref:Uncharacterized protein n=1 Tax=Ohessyouella blattaphilus TaxID=2949333 RepID=A0ABT1EJZ8_9FIRM|nr:hypothetical protein [Ohessyouella blattaphilus]MCP1111015.1 hypothetical protein [Ohessyouella blattaphilus]MCR8564409.1 hypothetical protein [Ohessyouella blattaphilus]MDL2251175.1 hypothetical protein [Lachnospiraceae bacterium OttesenSCG-928-J05]
MNYKIQQTLENYLKEEPFYEVSSFLGKMLLTDFPEDFFLKGRFFFKYFRPASGKQVYIAMDSRSKETKAFHLKETALKWCREG